jgi:hypothetical protein
MAVVLNALLHAATRVLPQVLVVPKPGGAHLLVGPAALQPNQMLRVTVLDVVCVTVENVMVEPPVAALHRTSMLPAPAGAAHVPTDRG